MDNDLDRSLRLLEDALSIPGKGLFKPNLSQIRKKRHVDFSVSSPDQDIRKLMESFTKYEDTMSSLLQCDKSMTGSIIQAKTPWKTATDSLYMEFLEILQGYSGGHDILEVLSDLARCCSDALNVVKGLQSRVAVVSTEEEKWLENERNTWRLLFILYQDRFQTRNLLEDDVPSQYFGVSEKYCVQNLYKRDHLLRECQLVIDWLERNAADRDDDMVHFSDSTVGWENTLHQLKSGQSIAFESSRQIVDKLYPDAPHYQKLPLHDLDMQDEERLNRKVFTLIRCGKLAEGQQLCTHSGHAWRAAMYEGWRLYHNPNLPDNKETEMGCDDEEQEDSGKSYRVEGNANRDIWKIMGIKYCKKLCLNKHEKASVASLCGYLDPLLQVCDSWEDQLWAHIKVMVDIRVESEIRDCVSHSYRELPAEYWEQRLSLNDIFESLESSRNETVRNESKKPDHVIQKHIILDEIPRLICKLEDWVDDGAVSTQFIRFTAHLALFLEQIGQAHNREVIERITEAYIMRLCEMNETQLVAYYVGKLSSQRQVHIYSNYLERIVDNEARQEALNYAESFGLNVLACTKQVVENIRSRPHEMEESGGLQARLTEVDKFKISALDWVIFYEAQRAEALQQTNALIFTFLTLGKFDAAVLAFKKIPPNSIEKILSEGEVGEETNQAIKEYLSYRAYLNAHEAFNEWFKHYQNQPICPDNLSEHAQFTEKVAHEHKIAQYKADLERWKMTSSHLAKTAKTMLYNVLLFPEGWLVGAQDADYLRSKCIPEVVLLLYTVLFDSDMHEECVQLADIIACEKHQLYKAYTKEKLGDLLTKLCESSVALLNVKKDPWGNDLYA